jgi:hypothetical protein
MTKQEFLNSNYFKFLLPIIGFAIAIALWRNGYEFGQWLQGALH